MAHSKADPGGVFESDTHRRVLGHLPVPGDPPMLAYDDAFGSEGSERELRRRSLFHRMQPDTSTNISDPVALAEILADLEADGYASQKDGGWKMTKKGLDALTGPVAEAVA